MSPVTEVTPVGQDAAAQADGTPQVEHVTGGVPEPVHARRERQPHGQIARRAPVWRLPPGILSSTCHGGSVYRDVAATAQDTFAPMRRPTPYVTAPVALLRFSVPHSPGSFRARKSPDPDNALHGARFSRGFWVCSALDHGFPWLVGAPLLAVIKRGRER